MSVHSRPSMQYQDGMELRDRKMTKDCKQPLRIGNIRALNGLKVHALLLWIQLMECQSLLSSHKAGRQTVKETKTRACS